MATTLFEKSLLRTVFDFADAQKETYLPRFEYLTRHECFSIYDNSFKGRRRYASIKIRKNKVIQPTSIRKHS